MKFQIEPKSNASVLGFRVVKETERKKKRKKAKQRERQTETDRGKEREWVQVPLSLIQESLSPCRFGKFNPFCCLFFESGAHIAQAGLG